MTVISFFLATTFFVASQLSGTWPCQSHRQLSLSVAQGGGSRCRPPKESTNTTGPDLKDPPRQRLE